MIASAVEMGLADLSITEHISQFKELRESVKFGSIHNSGRIFGSLKEYAREFDTISDIGSITVHRGLEVDFSPRFEARVAEFVNRDRWEILLCSVHEFEDTFDIERGVAAGPKYVPYSRWREYLELEKSALKSDSIPFHVLAHPVRLSRGLEAFPADMEDLLLELAETARERGKALELNGKDMDYSPRLVRMLAGACEKAECKVSLGSDAHYPKEVFRNMELAERIVQDLELELFVPGDG